MDPQKYLELDTHLQVAKAEEYLGREWARYQLGLATAANFAGRAFVQEWVVTDGNPYYPLPPDSEPPANAFLSAFTYFWVRAKMKNAGGVLTLEDLMLTEATQVQTLSDESEFSIDFDDAKTFEELSPEAQLLIRPPVDPNDET